MDEPLSSISPPTEVLDDLDLLRSGALGADATVEPAIWLSGTVSGHPGHSTDVTDGEGVVVARLHWGADGVMTKPTWLGRRSSRPFERFHVEQARGWAGTLLVLDRATTDLEAAAAAATSPLRLLVLVSTDGGDPAELAAVRAASRVHEQHPGSELVVGPLGRRAARRTEKRARVVAAYGQGARVVDLGTREGLIRPDADGGGHADDGGLVIFFTGLSGSGKSTLARAVRNGIVESSERPVSLLDGDVVRRNLSKGLDFSVHDRDINIRRIGWVAAEIVRHGGLVICSPIAPFDRTRRDVRDMVEDAGGRFLLVHVATPLEECERRDRKGLYAQARRGEIPDFTGISSPYEAPTDADLVMDTTDQAVEPLRDAVLAAAGLAPTAPRGC